MKTLAERLTPEKVEEIIGLWVKSRHAAGLVISDLSMTDLNDFISLFKNRFCKFFCSIKRGVSC